MKRQKIVLIVCGALLGGVCLVEIWFLFSAMRVRSAAADERNAANDELRGIYGAKVFPSDANISRVNEDAKALQTWVEATSKLVHQGDLNVESNTPPVFKRNLTETVRMLSQHPGAVKGKIVDSGFTFGFDKYLGDSASLPERDDVWRLTQQLEIIKRVCRELFAANILSLDEVQREVFEEGKNEEDAQEKGGSSRRRRNRPEAGPAAPARRNPAASRAGEFYSKQRFTFVFKARPAAFVEVLNRLAATDLFLVVAEVSLQKTDDPLLKWQAAGRSETGRAGAEESVAKVDLATIPHAERIVTNPELEPPVSVRIELDVYSFEGV